MKYYNNAQIAGLDTCSHFINANCKIMHNNTLIQEKKYFLQKKTEETLGKYSKEYSKYSENFDGIYKDVPGLYAYIWETEKNHVLKHVFRKIINGYFKKYYYGKKVDIELSMFDIIAADENTQAIEVDGKLVGGSKKIKSRRTRRTRKTRKNRRTRK